MTTHDFWMLGTGAVLTLIFTGTAKWLFRLFDAIVPVTQAPDRLRAVLSVRANRSLFWTSLMLLFEIGSIVSFAFEKGPITRLSILYAAMLVVLTFLFVCSFLWHLSFLPERRKAKDQMTVTR